MSVARQDTEDPLGSSDALPQWVDNHCHIDARGVDDGVLTTARSNGVVAMITVGTDVASSTTALELARGHSQVWATAGVHPHEAKDGTDGLAAFVSEALSQDAPLVAIGECGLDYHYNHSPREDQRNVFAEQIRLAHEINLPLVIHTREAWDETFEILDAESLPPRTVFHCFTGGAREAERCLERGAYLSISGIVTFPSAHDVRSAVEATPIERLMVETDSPYLTPVPYRGEPNTPAFVPLVGQALAKTKDLDLHEVARATTANSVEFYRLRLDRTVGGFPVGDLPDRGSPSESITEPG